jgi:hypothetical protein
MNVGPPQQQQQAPSSHPSQQQQQQQSNQNQGSNNNASSSNNAGGSNSNPGSASGGENNMGGAGSGGEGSSPGKKHNKSWPKKKVYKKPDPNAPKQRRFSGKFSNIYQDWYWWWSVELAHFYIFTFFELKNPLISVIIVQIIKHHQSLFFHS